MSSRLVIALLLAGCLGASPAVAASPDPCLSSGDALDVVSNHKVVSPGEAIVMARRTVPDGDVLRAKLCGEPDTLVYAITVLRTDGKLVRVMVDAPSGKLKTVR